MAHDLRQSGPFIGAGGMAVALFLYVYAAVALPSLWHTLVMPVFWLVMFLVSCAWFTRRPRAVVAIPVVAVAVWFPAMLLGARA